MSHPSEGLRSAMGGSAATKKGTSRFGCGRSGFFLCCVELCSGELLSRRTVGYYTLLQVLPIRSCIKEKSKTNKSINGKSIKLRRDRVVIESLIVGHSLESSGR